MKKLVVFACLLFLCLHVFPELAFAKERLSEQYDMSHFKLMVDDSTADGWLDEAVFGIAIGLRDFLWNMLLFFNQIIFYAVYNLFSVDFFKGLTNTLSSMASSTAGQLFSKMGSLALACFAAGLVIRAYLRQNWGLFFKTVLHAVFTMMLLFSLQSKQFNYVSFAVNLSNQIESSVSSINPALVNRKEFGDVEKLPVNVENAVFGALQYRPYLLLQYGTANEDVINKEDSKRISSYLNLDKTDADNKDAIKKIVENERETYKNKNISITNAWLQVVYVLMIFISNIIQGALYLALVILKLVMQLLFILVLALFPFVLFISLFPSMENVQYRYYKSLGIVILLKALMVFVTILVTSLMQLSYVVTNGASIIEIIFNQIIIGLCMFALWKFRIPMMGVLMGGGFNYTYMLNNPMPSGGSMSFRGHKETTRSKDNDKKDDEETEDDDSDNEKETVKETKSFNMNHSNRANDEENEELQDGQDNSLSDEEPNEISKQDTSLVSKMRNILDTSSEKADETEANTKSDIQDTSELPKMNEGDVSEKEEVRETSESPRRKDFDNSEHQKSSQGNQTTNDRDLTAMMVSQQSLESSIEDLRQELKRNENSKE
ncbi:MULTISPECIES: CD3337/EF1877 family mobilome membrane protein [Listeria]|uniref:CD3337/EF1877 family mobilome membrane protein n=1 Tax=Listeria TaxID=1637 RepID=UPI000B592C73|nr:MULTISPECIES: type IV secretion system protein [Listeria]